MWTLASPGVLPLADDTDPFLASGWLALDRGDGVRCLVAPGCALPFVRPWPMCAAIGGYVFSELSSPVAGEAGSVAAAWPKLPHDLATSGVHALFAEMPRAEFSRGLEAALASARWRVELREGRHGMVVRFPGDARPGGFDAFFRAAHVDEFRKTRAAERKLAALGTVEMERVVGRMPPRLLPEMADVERRSWKSATGLFSGARGSRIAEALAGAYVHLLVLRIDGRAVAWDLDLRHGQVGYSFNRCFDDGLRKTGVGKLLHFRNLAVAWDEGLKDVRLLGDVDDLKRYLAADEVPRVRAIAFAPTLAGKMLHTGFRLAESWKRMRRAGAR